MVKPDSSVRPHRLTGKKGDYTFDMWVEIEGRPLKVYGVSEGEDGILEAWIVSEIGKVSLSLTPYGWIGLLVLCSFLLQGLRSVCPSSKRKSRNSHLSLTF